MWEKAVQGDLYLKILIYKGKFNKLICNIYNALHDFYLAKHGSKIK